MDFCSPESPNKEYIKLLLNPNIEMTLHSTLLMNLRAQSRIFKKKNYFAIEKINWIKQLKFRWSNK